MLCESRAVGKRRKLLHRILRQLTRQNPAGVRLVLADLSGNRDQLAPRDVLPGSMYLALGGSPSRALDLADRLNRELSRRADLLDRTDCSSMAMYESTAMEGARGRLPRLIVAMDEVSRLLPLAPELRTALTRASRVGERLGVHLLLFTDGPEHQPLEGPFWNQFPARIRLLGHDGPMHAPEEDTAEEDGFLQVADRRSVKFHVNRGGEPGA